MTQNSNNIINKNKDYIIFVKILLKNKEELIMSLYGANTLTSMDEVAKGDRVLEMFFVDDLLRQSSDQIKQFCESQEAKILQEKAVLKKPTMMRLSKEDDIKRRIKLMAYQLAKEANDPEWVKLKKYTALRKESIAKIMNKYGAKAERMAKIAQKNYIATAQKVSSDAK